MDIRQAILSSEDHDLRKVAVPEWGVDVYIGSMTAGERDKWENEWLQQQNRGGVSNFRAKFLVCCLCDKSGNRIFSPSDVEELSKKKASVVSRLFEIAREQNALTPEQVDELAKN